LKLQIEISGEKEGFMFCFVVFGFLSFLLMSWKLLFVYLFVLNSWMSWWWRRERLFF